MSWVGESSMTLRMEASYSLSLDTRQYTKGGKYGSIQNRPRGLGRLYTKVQVVLDIFSAPFPALWGFALPPLRLAGANTQGPTSPQFDAPSCDPLWLYSASARRHFPFILFAASYQIEPHLTSALQPSARPAIPCCGTSISSSEPLLFERRSFSNLHFPVATHHF
jgi:hypothetical protein